MRTDTQKNFDWSGRLEQLEERLAMSASPWTGAASGLVQHGAIDEGAPALTQHIVADAPALDHHLNADSGNANADFWIDISDTQVLEDEFYRLEQSLSGAYNQSGLAQVRENYGFRGTGQTVAIIDSGIAYDHFALGGGMGSQYRVVGGYDFTGENDANPYDDGPNGSHGTHVSGIVGADGGAHEGVAPGVDLVGLRVFDDGGFGSFGWVEDALNWIHVNRDSFENPITAVNLSLGVADWNADSIPEWAMLENEFAQLEADGIFISVSAGNSFSNDTYNSNRQPGLSYPAASPYVIPVASVDDNGLLSYYSQRNSRVIAAPGRGILSTVPDYKGDHNGVTDDYASYSGTSMAAPYVAGASVIIREAMEFAGYTDIDQDTIYNHMIATADTIADSVTGLSYSRLNLSAAIDALMPVDDYGSTLATAYDVGTVGSTASLAGAIAKLDDVDYFRFTAGETGTMQFSATGNHNFVASYTVNGAAGAVENGTLSFLVAAGSSYTVSIHTSNGLGFYDAELSLESAAPEIIRTDVAPNGEVFTLDSENWLSIDGHRYWRNTGDFDFAPNSNFVWQSTSGLLQRHSGRGWETLDNDAIKFETNDNSRIYSQGKDNWLNVNGVASWGRTNDFYLASNMDLFWQNEVGLFQRLDHENHWSTFGTTVQQFAVRADGVAYAITAEGDVTVDGVKSWSNISDMHLDSAGNLILQGGGKTFQQMGSFFISTNLARQESQSMSAATNVTTNTAPTSSSVTPTGMVATAIAHDLAGLQAAEMASAKRWVSDETLDNTHVGESSPAGIENPAFASWSSYDVVEALPVNFAVAADDDTAAETLDAIDSMFSELGEWV